MVQYSVSRRLKPSCMVFASLSSSCLHLPTLVTLLHAGMLWSHTNWIRELWSHWKMNTGVIFRLDMFPGLIQRHKICAHKGRGGRKGWPWWNEECHSVCLTHQQRQQADYSARPLMSSPRWCEGKLLFGHGESFPSLNGTIHGEASLRLSPVLVMLVGIMLPMWEPQHPLGKVNLAWNPPGCRGKHESQRPTAQKAESKGNLMPLAAKMQWLLSLFVKFFPRSGFSLEVWDARHATTYVTKDPASWLCSKHKELSTSRFMSTDITPGLWQGCMGWRQKDG